MHTEYLQGVIITYWKDMKMFTYAYSWTSGAIGLNYVLDCTPEWISTLFRGPYYINITLIILQLLCNIFQVKDLMTTHTKM